MATIKKDTLHPEGEPEVDIYPKTSIGQVENLQANLEALNGEIANISANVESKLDKTGGTISGSLTITGTSNSNIYEVKGSKILDYNSSTTTNEIYGININNKVNNKFEVTKGNIKVSLDMTKVGANDEFALKSNLPNTSSFPTLAGTNIWTGANIFDNSITTKGNLFVSNGLTSYTINAITRKGYTYTFPDDTGTFALTKNIPTRPQYLQGFGIETPTLFSFKIGIYHTLTITLIDSYKSTSIIIPNDYDGSQIDLDIDGDYFEVTLENERLSVKNITSNRSWLGKLE